VLCPEELTPKTLADHVLALPCVEAADGNVDALPTVLLEGLACGCPCISTKVSGVPEIIKHEASGLLVAPSDDAALSDALARVLQSPKLHRNLASGGGAEGSGLRASGFGGSTCSL
jgi:glycosyltransferase involved in cell wall biosynthesis